MIQAKNNFFISLFALSLILFLFACDDQPPAGKKAPSSVVQKSISLSDDSEKPAKKAEVEAEAKSTKAASEEEKVASVQDKPKELDHYDARGKIDPFKPLIQDRSEESLAGIDDRPKRIKTPLEKIALSQIRLVAVIFVPGTNKHIAMVEEASGKGYEIGVGTYIGKNEGKVAQIKESSIVVKELVKDFKGRLKEKFHEIKLHKNDGE